MGVLNILRVENLDSNQTKSIDYYFASFNKKQLHF